MEDHGRQSVAHFARGAEFVKVTARICEGRAIARDSSRAMRVVSTLVLPEPAPASTSAFSQPSSAALRCMGLREFRKSSSIGTVSWQISKSRYAARSPFLRATSALHMQTKASGDCSLKATLTHGRSSDDDALGIRSESTPLLTFRLSNKGQKALYLWVEFFLQTQQQKAPHARNLQSSGNRISGPGTVATKRRLPRRRTRPRP